MSGSDADLLEALTTQPRSTTYANSLRCGTLINELLKQPSVVSHVYHSRRHLILVYNDQKSLVAFDNVPQWAHPERLDTNAILQSLLSDAPSPPHMLSTRQNSRILHVELDPSDAEKDILLIICEDGEVSSWEWQPESWKWVSQGFRQLSLPDRVLEAQVSRVIKCPIVTSSKRIYWIEDIVEDTAASSALRADPRSRSRALLCLDYRYADPPSLRPQDAKSGAAMLLEVANPILLGLWSTPVLGMWIAPREGLWLHFASSSRVPALQLGFFSSMTKKLTSFKSHSQPTFFVHHPTSLEMTTFDRESGVLSVLRPTSESTLSYEALSQITLPTEASFSSMQLHQHFVALLNADGTLQMFDARSGIPLHTLALPFTQTSKPLSSLIPLSKRDTSLGFWSTDGAWRIKSMPISHYAQLLASAMPSSSAASSHNLSLEAISQRSEDKQGVERPIQGQLSAALLSHDWGLGRLEAEHLLEILIAYTGIQYPTVQDTVTFISACDRLVPHLQSPIILISILEQAKLSAYACAITKHFIDACLARHSSGMSIVSQNEVDARAFRLFTTFNTDTIHLLRKFVELASPRDEALLLPSTEDKPADEDSLLRHQILALTPAECAKLDLNMSQVYFNHCPDALMAKLEEFATLPASSLANESQRLLDADVASASAFIRAAMSKYTPLDPSATSAVNSVLLREDERPTHLDTLDSLVFLFYRYKPHWILPLIDMLLQREGNNEGRSLLPRRAAAALPPLDSASDSPLVPSGASSDPQHKDKSRLEDLRLVARIGLLQRAQRPGSALKLLLHLYLTTRQDRYWDLVLGFIDLQGSSNQAKKTQVELLTSLLMQCLVPMNRLAAPRHVEAIWQRLPSNLSPLDLVTSIRQEIARIQPQQRPPVLVSDEASQVSLDVLRKQLLKIGV